MSELKTTEKPTFTAGVPQEIADQRKTRPEVGQIWNKQSKSTSLNYMTIRLKMTKEKLKQILEQEPNQYGEVSFNLVAFPNKNQQGVDRRPSFRIYEELTNTTK